MQPKYGLEKQGTVPGKEPVRSTAGRGFLKGLACGLTPLFALMVMAAALPSGKTSDDALFIDSQGRIGIGTTQPEAELDVRGSVNAVKFTGDGSDLKVENVTLAAVKRALDMLVPIGTILPYGGSEEPEGWLFCDGRELRRDKYQDLYEVIGANSCKKREASSNETFCLPDLRGRVAVGAGAGENLTPRTLGERGGKEKHTLIIDEMPEHFHSLPTRGLGGRQPKPEIWALQAIGKGGYEPHKRETNKKGRNQAHENMPPFLVVNYIIKYRDLIYSTCFEPLD